MEYVLIFVCVYINAVENSVTLQLYLRHDFYNMDFKSKTYVV
jgi:hypothetical protein